MEFGRFLAIGSEIAADLSIFGDELAAEIVRATEQERKRLKWINTVHDKLS